ncbi:virion core protein [Sheeppox virus]|uniref:Virion core protein n=1 Tax=Sheeppox virus TaxID=10266 RepID=A0A5C0PV86_SHEV|nr:virion core protein [Sheeppox virus]QEJ80436.1 virion core protein [Sheeppox virus]QOK36685.1 virion core protein [Sheeppox virus]QQG63043.1 virion core protein [Sheeppox virus]QRU95184.1 virion core protein [Sheeppox virus]
MDKLRTLYYDFFNISKKYLEKETNALTSDPNFELDVSILMNLVPVLEKKISSTISVLTKDEDIILMMKYCNYKLFSFWFLKSDAVVKSVYNKLELENEKERFKTIFKDMLINVQTLISINNMYINLKQDTAEIVSDSKKIIDIINQIKNTNCESSAYKLLQNNHSFIVKTINKILSDENYLLKIIAVFDSKLLTDKSKLTEYREIFTISTESIIHGIKCISDLEISTIDVDNNKYIMFFKKILGTVILFQNNDLNSQKFIYIVAKLYSLINQQFKTNPNVGYLLTDVLDSIKTKISIDDIKQKGVNNLQSLIRFISDNKSSYKSILSEEYIKREGEIIDILQNISNENKIEYCGKIIDIRKLIKITKDRFFKNDV